MDESEKEVLRTELTSLLQRREELHQEPSSQTKTEELTSIRNRKNTVERLLSPAGTRNKKRAEQKRQHRLEQATNRDTSSMNNHNNDHGNGVRNLAVSAR